MGEIGSGSGSSYPGTLDTNATVETNAPNPGKTKAKAEIVNDLAACILAIETELGVDPAGSKATVVARLDQEHNADGSHKDTLIVTVSGHNQNITGRKVFASGISLGVDGLYGTSTGHEVGKTTVGASGAMWFSDDIRTSGSIYSIGTKLLENQLELSNKNDGATTLLSTSTNIASVALGSVTANDRYLMSGQALVTKGASAGRTFVGIGISSGSATFTFLNTGTGIGQSQYQQANEGNTISCFGILRILTPGTLAMRLYGYSENSNGAISADGGQIYCMKIR